MKRLNTLTTFTSFALLFNICQASTGTTTAVCNDTSFSWATNSKGVSPCQIGANLGAVCEPTQQFNLAALQPVFDNGYLPPDVPTACECSTVFYSVVAACGLCQGGIAAPWGEYATNCTGKGTNGSFPNTIPAGTDVPRWAYLDVVSGNIFDPTAAQAVGDTPEVTAGSAAFAKPGSSKKSSNVGAIVGGVVGGVAAIAIIGGLVFFFWRRRKMARTAPSQQYGTPYNMEKLNAMPENGNTNQTMPAYSYPVGNVPQKPYDPNDPSTFPQTPASTMVDHNVPYNTLQYPSRSPPPMEHKFPRQPDRTELSAPFTDHGIGSNTGSAPPAQRYGQGYSGVAEV